MPEKYIKAADCEKYFYDHLDDVHIAAAMNAIDEMPDADVAPVRHGHWIINSDGYYPQCSECMSEPRGREMTKYCGECGAKMDGDKYARKIH